MLRVEHPRSLYHCPQLSFNRVASHLTPPLVCLSKPPAFLQANGHHTLLEATVTPCLETVTAQPPLFPGSISPGPSILSRAVNRQPSSRLCTVLRGPCSPVAQVQRQEHGFRIWLFLPCLRPHQSHLSTAD